MQIFCAMRIKFFLLYAFSLLLLVACGGGSSSMPTASNEYVEPLPIPFSRDVPSVTILNISDDASYTIRKTAFEETSEYEENYLVTTGSVSFPVSTYYLPMIKAAAAYARGATGASETILVVDTGIRDTHREFRDNGFLGDDKVVKVTQSGYIPTDAQKAHGTFVAALAAANRDGESGVNMHGVAFDAKIAFLEISLDSPSSSYEPTELGSSDGEDGAYKDARFAALFNEFITFAKANNAAIFNSSFGVQGVISQYNEDDVRSRLQHTAEVLAQEGVNVPEVLDADKVIIVWAAGNSGSKTLPDGAPAPVDSPELWQGLGVYFPALQKNTIAVVALDPDGSIASYSNHCGIAKSFCLAAPGSSIISAASSSDNSYILSSGTSAATPIVSGSLALLRQYFRHPTTFELQLGNTELVTRLLATADRSDYSADGGTDYSNSDIYGHGLVDLDAATKPVGVLMTSLPGDPNSRLFGDAGITLSGNIFGSLLQRKLAGVEVAGFDALGAPFFKQAATWITSPQKYINVKNTVQKSPISFYQNDNTHLSLDVNSNGKITRANLSFADGWWFSYRQHVGQLLGLYNGLFAKPISNITSSAVKNKHSIAVQNFSEPLAFTTPYLSFVRNGIGVAWLGSSPDSRRFSFALMHGTPQFDGQKNLGGEHGFGVILDYPFSTSGLILQAGVVHEPDGFLGARPEGAFGKARALTTFSGINGIWEVGSKDTWHVLASAYFGHTRPQVDSDGFLRDSGTIFSNTFSIGAISTSLWREDDWFGLRLSQPLRVEDGAVKLRFPSGRTKYGEIVYKNYDVSLTPSGRTLQAEVAYHLPLSGGKLKTNVRIERDAQYYSEQDTKSFINLFFEQNF